MSQIDRRRFLVLGAGVVVGAGALPLLGCGSDPLTVSPTTTGGSLTTFRSPSEISSVDGLLETTLTAVSGMVPFGDSERWAYSYDGSSPGPTLRVKPGDLMRILVRNKLDNPTNLHTHGLHVSPEGNSDNVFVSIGPGEEFLFEIRLPENHRGGTYWYHPHRHGYVAEQVAGGMAGMILVEDDYDSDPVLAAATERVMVLNDPKIASDSSAFPTSMMDRMMGREGDLVTVNGVHHPRLSVSTGSLERWRLVNASSSRFYDLSLAGAPMMLAGNDGGLMGTPQEIDSLLLAPGERAELLVPVTDSGSINLHSHYYNRGGMGGSGSAGTTDLVTLEAVGAPAQAAVPTRIKGAEISPPPAITGRRSVEMSMSGMSFRFDGKTFDPARIDQHLVLGDVEEWTITNTSMMDHPFHIHVWQFQVTDASDRRLVSPGLKDTVVVPAGGWVKFVLNITDIPGRAVYHCHILDHEDQGMMGVFEATVA
ncbi:MAG: multicopper oxidase family protein [Acidimicrobiia bacterium]|nr:multicopper oxidase family protein [Actinomycetota bacterium]MBL6925969.1 multicopper oxidase family protein [Acidimicrobiia bacterium]